MRDLAGFLLLLLVLLAALYLTVDVVIPFLLQYAFGFFAFFVVATVLVLKGRLHPSHLESLLKPGVAPTLAGLAVAVPLAHSAAVWLAGAVEEWWVLFVANATFPVLWTGRLLLAHRRQKARYTAEGHDLEDLIEKARRREAALEVLDDALVFAASHVPDPEPWEREVGLGPLLGPEDPDAIPAARERVKDLREQYRSLATTLEAALKEVRSTGAVPGTRALAVRSREALAVLEATFQEAKRTAEQVLALVTSGAGIPGLEEVR